eukprot:gene19092-6407_t
MLCWETALGVNHQWRTFRSCATALQAIRLGAPRVDLRGWN